MGAERIPWSNGRTVGMLQFEKPRILLGITLLWLLVFVIAFSDAGVPFPTWLVMEGAFLIIVVAWIVQLAVTIARQRRDRTRIRLQWACWVSIPAILISATLLGASPTLLTARVYLSSDSLIQADASEGPTDHWIGLFHIREISRFENELRFLTNECGLVDTCGVIFSPESPPKRRGEDSFTHLYGPWWHWHQSW